MKIKDLEFYSVATPPPHIGGMYWLIIRLRTECGLEGCGEIYAATFHPEGMATLTKDVFDRYLLGEDPHHIERFYRQAFSSGFTQRPDLTMLGIISGLEMACWDIIGKAAEQPVYQLLGGQIHEKLRCYTYLYPLNEKGEYDYQDPDLAAECAQQNKDQGFTAVKFDPAGPYTAYSGHQLPLSVMRRCETFCSKIRTAVGDDCDLLFGTHGQMVPSSAIRLAQLLEPYQPLWLEEPVPPGSPEAMAQVANATSIPIATGERLCSKLEFHQLLQAGGASILQMNLGRVGGLLEAKKIAAIAEVYYAQIAPHLYNGSVGAAASIQLATATPNFLIQESIGRWEGFHAEILKTPIQWQDGYLIPPSTPGLGIEVDWETVKTNAPYKGTRLHLQMQSTPISQNPDEVANGTETD